MPASLKMSQMFQMVAAIRGSLQADFTVPKDSVVALTQSARNAIALLQEILELGESTLENISQENHVGGNYYSIESDDLARTLYEEYTALWKEMQKKGLDKAQLIIIFRGAMIMSNTAKGAALKFLEDASTDLYNFGRKVDPALKNV